MRALKRLSLSVALLALVLALSVDTSVGQSGDCTVTVQPSDSIQQAIDAFGWGPDPVVCLAGGTWEENLRVKRNLTLRGQGPNQSTIKGTQPGHPVIWIESSDAIDVTLRGLSVTDAQGMDDERDKCADGSQENWICPYGVKIAGQSEVAIRDAKINDNGRFGLAMADSASLDLSDSTVSNNYLRGLSVFGSTTATIQGTDVNDNGSWGGLHVLGQAEIVLRDNRFLDNPQCGIAVWSTEATVEGTPNEMSGNAADLCAYAPPSVREPLTPETDRTELSVPGDYDTLQKAVDAVAPGGTITVNAGAHDTNATIWKRVTLKGQGPDQSTLRTSELAIAVIAEAGQATIRDLRVRVSPPDSSSGMWLYGNTTLANVKVSQASWAVSAGLEAQVAMRNMEITRSHNRAIGAWGSAQVDVADSTITENHSDGVVADESSQMDIANSEISRNGNDGVIFRGEAQATLTESRIAENEDDGIALAGSVSVDISDNTISGNADCGIVIDPDEANEDLEIRGDGNDITDNSPNICDPANLLPPGFEVDLD